MTTQETKDQGKNSTCASLTIPGETTIARASIGSRASESTGSIGVARESGVVAVVDRITQRPVS